MICVNCSAQYSDDSLTCPYCGSENSRVANKLKEEILEGYDREAEQIPLTQPKKMVNKWTKYIVRGVIALIVFCIVLIILSIVWGRVSASHEEKERVKNLEHLEELFSAGDLEGMCDYMQEGWTFDSSYEKYTQVYYVMQDYEYVMDSVKYIEKAVAGDYDAEHREEILLAESENLLTRMSQILQEAGTAMNDRAIFGNEKVLEKYYGDCVDFLMKQGFTEEEIAEITIGEESPKWQELNEKMLVISREMTPVKEED